MFVQLFCYCCLAINSFSSSFFLNNFSSCSLTSIRFAVLRVITKAMEHKESSSNHKIAVVYYIFSFLFSHTHSPSCFRTFSLSLCIFVCIKNCTCTCMCLCVSVFVYVVLYLAKYYTMFICMYELVLV